MKKIICIMVVVAFCFGGIQAFANDIDYGKIAKEYRDLTTVFCSRGEFFLASWCYERSRLFGSPPDPYIEARLFPGPREISNGSHPVFFRSGLEKHGIWIDNSVYLFGFSGVCMKIQITSKARFVFDNPDYLDPYIKPYDLSGSKESFYEVHIPPDFDLLTPMKPAFSKMPVEPLDE